jgi:hypothetical protein
MAAAFVDGTIHGASVSPGLMVMKKECAGNDEPFPC